MNHSRFFSRNSAGKYQLDVTELRAAFSATGDTTSAVKHLRLGRIASIIAGDTPVPLHPGPRVVLHLVPLASFDPTFSVDLARVRELSPTPLNSDRSDARFNLEGLLYTSGESGEAFGTYLQVFRNGVLETVSSRLGWWDDEAVLRTAVVEQEIFEAVDAYHVLYERLAVTPPIAIFLSFLGVNGFKLVPAGTRRLWIEDRPGIRQQDLLLPESLIVDVVTDAKTALKPILDVLWQAFGWDYCRNYDGEGHWGR